jgi:hypothetical protein
MIVPDYEVGVFPDESHEDYHRRVLGVASNSGLKWLRRSPAHYRAWCVGEIDRQDTKALRLGRIGHVCVLEPARFDREVLVEPDFGDKRSPRVRADLAAWREAQSLDAIFISEGERESLMRIRDAVWGNAFARNFIENSIAEVSMRFRDDETGVPCKIRMDAFSEKFNAAADLKIVLDASPKAFSKSAYNYSYHTSQAFYVNGARILGMPVENYVFIVVEKEPPYVVQCYHLDEAAEEVAFKQLSRDLPLLAKCAKQNNWPGYSQRMLEGLSLPGYAFSSFEN